ncbi:MAG: 5'/3'-nucleotidase SurE [Oscillatoria sp. SIO1A7]|nr:5'/3'-nucleotidase SurE [Oscillatoria sp. SIO1A7]
MKLLISNDDGIFAAGVRALANTMAEAGHEVFVVCPDRERSATGHGITMHQPIRAEVVESIFHPGIKAWSCSGTPSDCVKLALWALLDSPPDLVLSGINQGQNLGTDILYSGTVSAAMEGLIEGIPSVAFSFTSYTSREFQPAANFARTLVAAIAKTPLPLKTLLNVNVPDVPTEKIAGVVLARQGVRRYADVFKKRVDPRGHTYYWLAGEVIEDAEDAEDTEKALVSWGEEAIALPTDVQAIRENYITVTPLQYNLTDVSVALSERLSAITSQVRA